MVIMLAKTYIIVVCLLNDVTKGFFARRKILESKNVQITRGNINNLCSVCVIIVIVERYWC